MTPTNTSDAGVLAVVGDEALRHDVDRIAAAVGMRVVHVVEPSHAKIWTAAAAVLVDLDGARRCARLAMPRRGTSFLVHRAALSGDDWPVVVSLGLQRVLRLPDEDVELTSLLSDAAESTHGRPRRGVVIAVVGARGGAGASVFAAALAQHANDALLVDVDPWGGGIELVTGSEGAPGLRWSDLVMQGGRVGWAALRDALPEHRGATVLSVGRSGGQIDAAALGAVVDAGCRGGATVVCDVPRRATPAAEAALSAADLVVLVTPADVRSCAAATSTARWLTDVNANVGLVVRGPAPGGLTASDVEQLVGLPLLAAMRSQPGLANSIEREGLRPRRRSPLAVAARRVLGMLSHLPAEPSAA